MYHDQGLPVLKYSGFGKAVNITLGLPFIRTSVDHGTALDLAGSGRALKRVIEANRSAGGKPLMFATVFPYSSHNYLLRYWMADAGIDPDKDVRANVEDGLSEIKQAHEALEAVKFGGSNTFEAATSW